MYVYINVFRQKAISLLQLNLIYFIDATNVRYINQNDLDKAAMKYAEEEKRGKTAPARERRRNWLKESVEVKTHRGEKYHLKAPGKTFLTPQV